MKGILSIIAVVSYAALATNLMAQPQLVVQSGHQEAVLALAVSPDKTLVASAGSDKTIIVWDLRNGKQLFNLKKHSAWIFCLAFSPDGRFLASGSADGNVWVWDIRRGVTVQGISLGKHAAVSIDFSPDGKILAVSGNFPSVFLWDLADQKQVARLKGHSDEIEVIKFTPDGKHLVSVSRDLSVRLWNLTTYETERFVKYADKYNGELYLDVNPKGNLIVVGLGDSAFVWDLNGQSKTLAVPEGKTSHLDGILFIDDHQMICEIDQKLWVWDLATDSIKTLAKNPMFSRSFIALSKDKKTLAFSQDNCLNILDILTTEVMKFKCSEQKFDTLAFTEDGNGLMASAQSPFFFGSRARMTVDEAYSLVAKVRGPTYVFLPAVSELVAFRSRRGLSNKQGDPKEQGRLYFRKVPFEPGSKKPDQEITAHSGTIQAISANKDGTLLASCGSEGTIKLWNSNDWTAPRKILSKAAEDLALSPNGEFLVSAGGDKLTLWDTQTWEGETIANGKILQILISSDNKWVASFVREATPHAELKLWDVAAHKLKASIMLDSLPRSNDFKDALRAMPFLRENLSQLVLGVFSTFSTLGSFSFSHDNKFLAYEYMDFVTGAHNVRVWDIEAEKESRVFPGHSSTVTATAFSPNGRILASASWDTTIKLWGLDTGEELATLVPVENEQWVIYTPAGRFDTNADIEDEEILHWSLPFDAQKVLPLDVFMRDYWEPGFFERLLDCTERQTCQNDSKTLRNLSELNIARPKVVITDVSRPDATGHVEITVEVSRGSELKELETGSVKLSTDVYDVRVFRDRQLIGIAPAEAAEKLMSEHPATLAGDLEQWRAVSEVKLDPQTGKQVLKFRSLLPRGKDPRSVTFSAYAFNNDRVKSPTARYKLPDTTQTMLPKAQSNLKKRAYIVSIGVSKSHLFKWNLNHGADDAHQFQTILPQRLSQVGEYEVVPIELISDSREGKIIDNATKQNIKAVLDSLAGKNVSDTIKKQLPAIRNFRAATPDDIVIITISSHGISADNDDFFLLPSDITQQRSDQDIPDLSSMISGQEMALWLRDIDAKEIAVVIDACKSSAAVESFSFKPGPLGSRGLGQVAYDKRMTVLASTQSSDDSLEVDGRINQGLLSYTLTHEAFSDAEVVKDGKVMLKDWLKFGAERVPNLCQDVLAHRVKGVVMKRKGRPMFEEEIVFKQRPSLFDFSRENGDIVLARAQSQSVGR